MASNFIVTGSNFFNQIRNGEDFSLNTGDSNSIIYGSVGDTIKLTETIQVYIAFNELTNTDLTFNELTFNSSISSLTANVDWFNEGFYPGGAIRVIRGTETPVDITILGITGPGNNDLTISSADATLLEALIDYDTYSDVVILLLSVPTFVGYKYGLNPVGQTIENYQSPFDSNDQAYYSNTIGSQQQPSQLTFTGGEEGSNLSESIDIAFIATTDGYVHEFEINHIFKITFYVSGELTNIQTQVPPQGYVSDNTFRFDNRYEFGTPTYHNSIFSNTGKLGEVGYFNQNYNGRANDYTIENILISNANNTGVLEATQTNTVTFDVVSSTDDFQQGITTILNHSRLPKAAEYQNNKTPFNDLWVFDSLVVSEGGQPSSSGIFTNLSVGIAQQEPKKLNVSVDISFDSEQQSLIDNSNYALWFTLANKELAEPELIDRISLVLDANPYSFDRDVPDLIDYSTYDLRFFMPYEDPETDIGTTDFTGGDGDFRMFRCNIDLDTEKLAWLRTAELRIITTDGVNEGLLSRTIFPITGIPLTFSDGTYEYQILNFDVPNSLNIPSDDISNRLTISINIPIVPSSSQEAILTGSFRVPWREWIENSSIPTVFYDDTKQNDNRNEKTSNYSNVDGYQIYGVMSLNIQNDRDPGSITEYNIFSQPCTILDFDSPSWTAGFTASTFYFDEDGIAIGEPQTEKETLVKIEFDHSLGTLSPQDLSGYMWIEISGSTLRPDNLYTDRDWTSPTNRLIPSQELNPSNEQFVELESINNKVTLICKIDGTKISTENNYRVYGRLINKA